MKGIKEITYTRGATMNRGNFNSERIDLSITVEVDARDPEAVYQQAREWVTARVAQDMKRQEQTS